MKEEAMSEQATLDYEAGDYLEDDPETWSALLDAIERYGPRFAPLVEFDAEGAATILAGTIASYLAARHGVYLVRRESQP